MAKKKAPTDLISAFTWAFNVIDNDDLPAAEQLTLLHILSRANRAFWKPIPISAAKLAASMCKDKRSVDKAIKALEEKSLIVKVEGGYTLGIPDDELNPFSGGVTSIARPEPASAYLPDTAESVPPARRTVGNDAGTRGEAGGTEGGVEDPAVGAIKYFGNPVPR